MRKGQESKIVPPCSSNGEANSLRLRDHDKKQAGQQMETIEKWKQRALEKANRAHAVKARTLPAISPRALLDVCFPLDLDFECARILASLHETVAPDGQDKFSKIGLGKPQFANASDESEYVDSVRGLLQARAEAVAVPLDELRLRYEKMLRLCDNDVRLAYTWGLMCLEHGKLAEAQERFQTVDTKAGGRFFPATRALVQTDILLRNSIAANAVVSIARAIALSEDGSLSPGEKEEYANWTGRAIALIRFTCRSEETAKKADAKAFDVFQTRLRAAYDSGKNQATHRLQELDADRLAKAAKTPKKPDPKTSTRGELLEKVRDQIEKKKLAVNAIETTTRNELERLRNQIGELDLQSKNLSLQANQLATAISQAQLQARQAALTNRVGTLGQGDNLDQPPPMPLADMANMKANYHATQQQMCDVQQRMKTLQQERLRYAAEQKSRYEELRKEIDDLEKKEKHLAAMVKHDQVGRESPAQISISDATLKAWVSELLPLNYGAEYRSIQASFASKTAVSDAPISQPQSPH